MNKIIGKFLLICFVLSIIGCFLMSQDLKLDVVKTPTFKEVGGFWYIYMDCTGPRNTMREKALAQIEEFKKQGIEAEWTFMTFYNWPETEDAELKWLRGAVVSEDTQCKPPLKKIKIEKFRALTYTLTGEFTIKEVGASNRLMDAYIKEKGYKHIWPIYEITRSEPSEFHFWYLVEE